MREVVPDSPILSWTRLEPVSVEHPRVEGEKSKLHSMSSTRAKVPIYASELSKVLTLAMYGVPPQPDGV